ncbi:MAG: substrate-binding domain-containing protein [Muribaculum sp.]|nr:substrate-binding domain-containing protein [Muribaculum sp.]
MKIRNIIPLLVTFCAIGSIAISCTKIKRGEYASGSATIYCDDGFRMILDEEIQVFEYSYPEASIIPFYKSEEECIAAILSDSTQAAIVTRDLTDKEKSYVKSKFKRVVKSKCIAVDAVALIVNKDCKLSDLSLDDIKGILNGQISNWNQLAVNDTSKIRLVFDSQGSSTVNYLRDKFLDKGKMISDNPNARAQKNNAQVFDYVKKDKNAIGVISVSWLGDNLQNAKKVPMDDRMDIYSNQNDTITSSLTTEVKILKVSNPTEANDFNPSGYLPYQLYINSGEYPLYRKVYMISTASNSTVMHSFYTFVTGFVGQKIISLTGIMPYNVQPRQVQLVDKK